MEDLAMPAKQRGDLIGALKILENKNYGIFIVGRRRKPSRFIWKRVGSGIKMNSPTAMPDQSRNRLNFTGAGAKGSPLPIMGLLAEESVISQRLKKFGRKEATNELFDIVSTA